ncbi:hypothetical protein Tco_0824207 [Tanacetum coccineum]|uniref:Uncharacterized protein n=1 Tax=Tanacetum coccineum TaxID=301880 RepID=A0ABQ5AL18_9ASTR
MIVEDQMKNTLKTEHPPRREASRLHRYEDPPESPRLRTKAPQSLIDVRVQESRIKKKLQEPSYVGALNDTSTQHKREVFEMKDRCSEKQVLGYVLTVGVTTVEWESRLQKSITIDVHQVGDEIEVEVLRNFNWPPSELITEDGFLPDRGYS